MSYTAPDYDAVDFTFVGATNYTAPANDDVDFTFTPDANTFSIGGTATTSFAPLVTFAIAGSGATAMVGYGYGYQDAVTTIGGAVSTNLRIFDWSSGAYTENYSTTVSFPTQTFDAGTYSLFDHTATTSFPSNSFGAGAYVLTPTSTATFDPYYALTINAAASTDMRGGGVDTQPFSSAGAATDTLVSQKLAQGFYDGRGRTMQTLYAKPIRVSTVTIAGEVTHTFATHTLFNGTATIDGSGTLTTYVGARRDGELTSAGAAYPTPVSSSYALASTTIYAAGELLYYIGAMRTESFSSAGTSELTGWTNQLRQGQLSVTGLNDPITFGSGSQVQALRYETTYVLTEEQDIPVMVVNAPITALLVDGASYFLQRDEQVSALLIPREIRVLPEHVQTVYA